MSLVQPARPGPNGGGNNAGVKRPYQLMINSAAHNSKDSSYSTTLKNMKIDKDVLDDLNEDNMVCHSFTISSVLIFDINMKSQLVFLSHMWYLINIITYICISDFFVINSHL